MSPRRCVIVGRGRAGGSFAAALSSIGWKVSSMPGRSPVESATLDGVDLVLLAVPDDAVPTVATSLPACDAVVAHVAGSLTVGVLGDHRRVGSIHPLMSLPDAATGGHRLLDACTFAVAGDDLLRSLVDDLGGTAIEVGDDQRVLYHAAASVAANHLTALCAQVERLAAAAGVPAGAYWPLMATTLANVARVGAAAALTGPASRGDWATVQRHLDHLPTDEERHVYRVLCEQAAALAARRTPDALTPPPAGPCSAGES